MIGSEYINLRVEKKPRILKKNLSDEEAEYFWRNRKGKLIFKPVYEQYNSLFLENILKDTSIDTAFAEFKDTAIYERYMLNAAQFSAAKSAAEGKMIQAQVFDEDKNVRSYSQFKKEAEKITTISQETWLRTEYESQKRSIISGEQFRRMMNDADLYPYWIYKGMMDSRERFEHVLLEGKVFRIGSPDSDACFPPNDWNCRCEGESIDDDYLKENKLRVLSDKEAKEHLEENVDEQFRTNPAKDGSMPKTGSYFQVLGSANEANYKTFELRDIDSDKELKGLSAKAFFDAKGLHFVVEIVHEWKRDYQVNKKNDIIFQNEALRTNVRFTNNSLHEVQKHSRGLENLPATIENPDEVWSLWENVGEQRSVLRNYITFGKTCYIVQSKDGVITDAFAVSNKQANKYRKGVLL